MLEQKKPTKMVYDILIKSKSILPTETLERWRKELECTTGNEEIIRSNNKQRTSTINQKLRSFNFNFLHRNVPYQSRLYNMKIKNSPDCNVCKCKESIVHLYWDCPSTKRLWERLKNLIEKNSGICFNLDKEKCLLGTGIWYSTRKKEVQYMLCILTKHYIHLCKCCEDSTKNTAGLELYLKSKLKLEHMISLEKGTQNWFTEKWGNWIPWINT